MSLSAAVYVTGVGNVAFAATFARTFMGSTRVGTISKLSYVEDRTSECLFLPVEYMFGDFIQFIPHTGRGGCNALWQQCVEDVDASDICVVCNDDIMFPRAGWLESLIQIFERNPNVAMAGIGADGAWADAHRVKERYFTDPSLLVEAVEHCESFRANPVKYVHHVSGPLWACKPKLWLEAGGIPEAYFWGFGEVVPCIELRKMGYQSAAVQYPCTILHYGGGAYYDIHSDRERDESFSRRSIELGDDGKLFAETYGTGHVHLLAQEFDAKLPSMGLPPIQYEISRKMED